VTAIRYQVFPTARPIEENPQRCAVEFDYGTVGPAGEQFLHRPFEPYLEKVT
jgi:hypothetical protein